jgi:pathogenesis-related protein 1
LSRRISIALTLLASSCAAQEILAAHNAARAKQNVPPLEWSEKLAQYAQEWADKLLAGGKFTHRPDHTYGENLFESQGGNAPPSEVVAVWTAEARDYDYASNKCRKVCGHYTQVMWATSKRLGCAVARDARREVWVCNYDPPGNWIGQRPY